MRPMSFMGAAALLLGCAGSRERGVDDIQAPFLVQRDTSFLLPFEVRTSLAWSDSGHVALIDGDQKQLVLVGLDGVQRRVGGPGRGPGEFQLPLQVIGAGRGELLVFDPFARSIQWFDRGLRPVRRMTTPHFANGILGELGDTLTLMWQVFPKDSLGRGVGRISSVGEPLPGSFRLGALDPVFSEVAPLVPDQMVPDPQALLRADGLIVLGESRDYRLWLLAAAGNVLATGGRPELPATEAPVASESDIQKGIADAQHLTHDPEMLKQVEQALRRQSGGPRLKFRHMALDSDRRLWVLGDRGSLDTTEVDLFDPDLRYLGTIPIPGAVWAIAVEGDRVATLSGTPADEPWILSFYTLRAEGMK